MARLPNPKSREKIIKNAIEIMHKEGYQALSMRKVALKSSMVVGNVYRYFPCKEALIEEIFKPVYDHLYLFLNMPFDVIKETHPTPKAVRLYVVTQSHLIASNIDQLLKIHYKEFQIIFREDQLSSKITHEVTLFLQNLLKHFFPLPQQLNEESLQLMKMFASSISAGVIEAINEYPKNQDYIAQSITNYLNIYANLLEIDIPSN